MDTINNYLKNLLISQELTPEQERTLQAHKKEVTDFLNIEFGDDAPKIKYAGSREKGTMIRDNYDLDIVCYFPSTDARSLKEIRDDVSVHLNKKYMMQEKASAERILNLKDSTAPHSYHIDVVPGRFIADTDDVFIYLAEGDKDYLKTNLKTHIETIVNSECVPVIRLAKIWAHRNKLEIKTFVLELFVVDALKGSRTKNDLKVSFLKVMEEMKNRFTTAMIEDPANTNNVVSRLVPSSSKIIVARAAETAFNKLDGSNELLDWKTILGDILHSGLLNTPHTTSAGLIPAAPWCD
jgi:hypothetical protein